jgi:hypothetical protein
LPPAKNYNNLVLIPVVRVAATEAKRIAVSEVLRALHMPIHPIATVLAAFPGVAFPVDGFYVMFPAPLK